MWISSCHNYFWPRFCTTCTPGTSSTLTRAEASRNSFERGLLLRHLPLKEQQKNVGISVKQRYKYLHVGFLALNLCHCEFKPLQSSLVFFLLIISLE